MGEHEAARAKLEAAFELGTRHGFRDVLAWHPYMLGHTLYPSGDREAARALWERCLEDDAGFQRGVATWSLGVLDVDAGKPSEAIERLEAGRARTVAAGEGLALSFIDAGIAVAHAALGRLDEARDQLPRQRRTTPTGSRGGRR